MTAKRYRLIIIDDEYVVIKGLRETIDWEALNIEIVAECRNGEEGLDAIHRLAPDIVISDIRMPKLDGLGLTKRLAEEKFDGAVIIYSGYSDFEYARKAIDYGVNKYILKPIENEILISGIKDAIVELEAERSKRAALQQYTMGLPLLKENLIDQILNGIDTEDTLEKLALIGITLPEKGTVIECSVLQNEDDCFTELFDTLLNSMDGFKAVGQKYSGRFVVISRLTRTSVIYNCAKEFLERNVAKSPCRMSVGISAPFGNGTTLQDAYMQAKALREDYLFPTVNNIKTSDEKIENKQRKKVIENALNIIVSDYGKKLSIKKIAEQLFVSESHLMHEFKEGLGKTFNECLTEYRILKAREFLAEGELRVNEIASKVGYSDVRYFGQIFKEATGMSPSEYVEKLKKE